MILPLTCSFIYDKTSDVHIEKSVFSNGLVSPISNSDIVRPRPIQE
jgi:hypothetical protein